MVMSGQSFDLTTFFLGRLRPPKWLTSTSSTYFRHSLTTAFLEPAEGEMKVCGQIGYQTWDLPGSTEDNSETIFLISQRQHML